MAIAFSEEKKRQKTLIAVFVILLAVTAGILAFWFMRNNLASNIANQPVSSTFRQPNIDLNIFENQTLKNFEVFESIKPFEGKPGRDNPFVPY